MNPIVFFFLSLASMSGAVALVPDEPIKVIRGSEEIGKSTFRILSYKGKEYIYMETAQGAQLVPAE